MTLMEHMAISNKHFDTLIYLSDLQIQCQLFKRSYEQLEIAAAHWISLPKGIDDNAKFSPLNIIAECTVCLSAMSAIKRVLELKKERGKKLSELLGNPPLENTFNKNVRNSWEHHDERLDGLLKNYNGKSRSLSEIHVSVFPPKETTIVLKRFDPTSMTIHFLNDVIELEQCFHEIVQLTININQAIQKLHN